MEKNSLKYTGLLAFIVWGALLLMHLLPSITMGGRVLRRVDILGDVRRPSKPVSEPDSLLPPPPKVKPAFVDTCRAGMTCIEDYSDSTMRGMTRFYQALDELAKAPRPVRIAYFGDSFIEADILTADLREMLQQKYGGCGVGFVTITSMTSGFRPTVRHSFSGWQSHSVMDSVFFDRSKLGVSGHYFIPNTGAYVELRGQKNYASRLDTCQRASIFFYNRGTTTLSVRVNRGEATTETFEPIDDLQEMTVEGNIGSVRWTVESADSTLFYGLAMDGTSGIVLDNFSLRGSSGLSLRSVPVWMMREFNEQVICRVVGQIVHISTVPSFLKHLEVSGGHVQELFLVEIGRSTVGGFRSCRRLIGKLIHCGTRTNGLSRIEGRLFSHSGFASALSEVGILSRLRGRSAGRCCGRSSALAGGEEAECHNGQQDKRQNHKHLGKSLTETEHIG